jgi:acetolactate synthase-1/2/3 large subunit
VVAEAFHAAATGRPGPVVVGLPEDVLVAPAAGDVVPPRPVPGGAVSQEQAGHLVALLERAQRPLVVVGGDRWDRSAAARLTGWCERWTLPVASDFRAHDIVDHASPSYAGWLGFGCDPAVGELLDQADLLVFVGCGGGDVLTGGYRRGRSAARVVVVDTDPELETHQLRVDLHLLAAPAALADAVAERLPDRRPPWSSWSGRARSAQQRFAAPAPDGARRGVDLGAAMVMLRERLDRDALLTYGAGNYAVWAQRYPPPHSYPSVLAPRNGSMGFGLPAGVAASLACPGRRVVTVTGDGDFLMNGQELATAVAHGARPLVLVVDNGMYGTIRAHQQRAYPGRFTGTTLVNPDFAAYSRAFGGFGEKVTRTDDFPAALERALGATGPALLHLVVDPDVLAPTPAPAS